MKIAIVVHGRFHAFDLARELLRRGHEVTLFTNYPKFVAARFGVPPKRVHSLVLHGMISRVVYRLREKGFWFYPEAWLHTWFGRWAASKVKREKWDVVICWSGIGEETFRALQDTQTLRVCQRGSAHIRTQARLLQEEETRTGSKQDQPSSWMITREEREYALADMIVVPSSFAWRTFLNEDVPDEKVATLLLGVDVRGFRPSRKVIEARCQRILSGEPLHVLYVGTFSFRKGMWDMRDIIRHLKDDRFRFRFVGPVASECEALAEELGPVVTFIPKQPQHRLPEHYTWGDVFVLPTIEDGYAMVLDQAAASGLPILTTTNCGGPDLLREGKTGWILPIRSPQAFIERLRWCEKYREELANMVQRIYHEFRPRDWADVAADLETLCMKAMMDKGFKG